MLNARKIKFKQIRKLGAIPGLTTKDVFYRRNTIQYNGKKKLNNIKLDPTFFKITMTIKGDLLKKLCYKQIIKRHFNITELQLKTLYKKNKMYYKYNVPLVSHKLEMRLDCILYRSGFALTILEARQIIKHGHIFIDFIKIKEPNYICSIFNEITVSKNQSIQNKININLKTIQQIVKDKKYYNKNLPKHLVIDIKLLKINIISEIIPNDILLNINELLLKEYYNTK